MLVLFSYLICLWRYFLIRHSLRDLVKLAPDAKIAMNLLSKTAVSSTIFTNILVITHVLGLTICWIWQTTLEINAKFDRSLRLWKSSLSRVCKISRISYSTLRIVLNKLQLSFHVSAVKYSKHALAALGSHQIVTIMPHDAVSILASKPLTLLGVRWLPTIDWDGVQVIYFLEFEFVLWGRCFSMQEAERPSHRVFSSRFDH